MTARRLAQATLRLYPRGFRHRYEVEMRALLDEQPVRASTVFDLLRGAAAAHLRPAPTATGELTAETRVSLSLSGLLACWVAFVFVGLAFYKTTEDYPFRLAGDMHTLLGDAHTTIQALAAMASVTVVLGALPLVALAFSRARHQQGRLRVLLGLPFVAAFVFLAATGLLLLLAGTPRHPGPLDRGVFILWSSIGVACGVVCVIAARNALFETTPDRSRLTWALWLGALAARVMVAIALATTLYTICLVIYAPGLASTPNGPLQAPSTGVSLVLQALAMATCSALAMLTVRRGRAALRRPAALSGR